MTTIEKLHRKAKELTHLNSILALLQWDQEIMLPRGGAAGRAEQLYVLSTIIHQKITAQDLGKILQELSDEPEKLSVADLSLIRVLKREYDKNTKLPEKFVAVVPDYYLRETDEWLVFPHELDALTPEELQKHRPGIAAIVHSVKEPAKSA